MRCCIYAGLVKGQGFAVDASVIEACNASRYHGKAPDDIDSVGAGAADPSRLCSWVRVP